MSFRPESRDGKTCPFQVQPGCRSPGQVVRGTPPRGCDFVSAAETRPQSRRSTCPLSHPACVEGSCLPGPGEELVHRGHCTGTVNALQGVASHTAARNCVHYFLSREASGDKSAPAPPSSALHHPQMQRAGVKAMLGVVEMAWLCLDGRQPPHSVCPWCAHKGPSAPGPH